MGQLKTLLSLVCLAIGLHLATAYDWATASAALVSGGDPTPTPGPVVYPPCSVSVKVGICLLVGQLPCELDWAQPEATEIKENKKYFQLSADICNTDAKCVPDVRFISKVGCTPAAE